MNTATDVLCKSRDDVDESDVRVVKQVSSLSSHDFHMACYASMVYAHFLYLLVYSIWHKSLFLPRDAMLSAVYAVVVCVCVCRTAVLY